MSYQVHITSTAEHDIMRAADYIEFTLKNPTAADNLLNVVTEQIGSLSDLPQKFRLVDDSVLVRNLFYAGSFFSALPYKKPHPL